MDFEAYEMLKYVNCDGEGKTSLFTQKSSQMKSEKRQNVDVGKGPKMRVNLARATACPQRLRIFFRQDPDRTSVEFPRK